MSWNDTCETWPEQLLIHQLFEIQAEKTPDRTALVFGETSLTYAELNRQAQQLANRLVARGAEPESVVGLCLERSEKVVIGVLGILKSGAAYLPLEPTFPDERLAYMLRDSGVSLLVQEPATADRVPGFAGERLDLERADAPAAGMDADARSPGPHDLAYVLYTSGSTGTPKGVAIEHRSVTNLLFSMSRRLGITTEEVVLSVAPYSFDVALPF